MYSGTSLECSALPPYSMIHFWTLIMTPFCMNPCWAGSDQVQVVSLGDILSICHHWQFFAIGGLAGEIENKRLKEKKKIKPKKKSHPNRKYKKQKKKQKIRQYSNQQAEKKPKRRTKESKFFQLSYFITYMTGHSLVHQVWFILCTGHLVYTVYFLYIVILVVSVVNI